MEGAAGVVHRHPEATNSPLDLDRVMASASRVQGEAELACFTSCADGASQSGAPALSESSRSTRALVEAALRRIASGDPRKWNVRRVAIVVRLGAIENGALSLIVIAVSARGGGTRGAAAQHAALEIKDKLTASIAPLCLGKEPQGGGAARGGGGVGGDDDGEHRSGRPSATSPWRPSSRR